MKRRSLSVKFVHEPMLGLYSGLWGIARGQPDVLLVYHSWLE